MAEIIESKDTMPVKETVEFESIKLDTESLNNLKDLNNKASVYVNDFGKIYLRKREIEDELENIKKALETGESEFKEINKNIQEIVDSIDDRYPQARIDITSGMVTYQPGAPTRRQQFEQQQQKMKEQSSPNEMKVVKE